MAELQQDDGADTALARLLHAGGSVGLPLLQASLEEVRRRRGTEPVTLADLLVGRGLVAREEVDAALARLAQDPTLVEETRAAGPPAPGPAPRQLGPYVLVRELARGGMGAVHEVEHEATGVRYALKTLLPGVLGADAREEVQRFAREAQAMARLEHPNVVPIHAAHLEPPVPYLVQDLLPGGTLQQRIQAGPLPVEEAVATATALARGLAHCHARGVLHRDLKPHNVLFDERGVPRLTDFGLALLGGAHSLTETGSVLGTPGYMAPEQALGLKELDARTDVYGLGAVLYAMLCGRPPFRGGGLLAVLHQVLNDPPERPRALRPEVPVWLEAVVLRALAKEPADRFPSASALADALEAAVEPAPRRPPWPALVGLLAVVVVALVAAAIVARPGPIPTADATRAPRSPSASPTAGTPSPSVTASPDKTWGALVRDRFTIKIPDATSVTGAFVGGRLVVVTSEGRILELRPSDPHSPRPLAAFFPGRDLDHKYDWPQPPLETQAGWVVGVRGGDVCLVPWREESLPLGRAPFRRELACTSFHRKGNLLAVGRTRGANGISVLLLPTLLEFGQPLRWNAVIEDLRFLPGRRVVAVTSEELLEWRLGPGLKPEVISLSRDYQGVTLAVEGTQVAVASRTGRLETFVAHSAAPLARSGVEFDDAIRRHEGSVRALCYARHGRFLIGIGAPPKGASHLQVWNPRTGRPLGPRLEVPRRAVSMTASRHEDGELLVVGSTTGRLTLVSLAWLLRRR